MNAIYLSAISLGFQNIAVLLVFLLLALMIGFSFYLLFINISEIRRWQWRHFLLGTSASILLVLVYSLLVSIANSPDFAMLNFKKYWYLFVPLIIGVGMQVGLFSYIRGKTNAGPVAATTTFSAGSMLACCAHLLVNFVPFIGIAGTSMFITTNQPLFLSIGILSNLIGLAFMIKTSKVIKWTAR